MKKIVLTLVALMVAVCCVMLSACSSTVSIGVQSGTTGQYFVDGDEDWGFDGLSGFKSKGYSNGGLAVNDLKNGQVKYVIIDQEPALQLEKAISGIKVVNIPLTEEEYAFGVDKAQAELLGAINNIIAEIKAVNTDGSSILGDIVEAYATGEGIKPVTSAQFDSARADQQLVVATNAAFAPFEYKDGDKFAGIDMEIAAYIASKLSLELVIMDMEFDSVVTSVGKNGVDVAMAGLTVNDTRKESVNFSESYYDAAQVLITLESDYEKFADCKTADDVIAALKASLK